MESERITILFPNNDIANLEIDTTATPDLECQHIIWQCIDHLKNVRAFNDNATKYAAMYLHAFGLQLVNPECSDKKQIWLPYWHKFGTVGNGTSKDQKVYKFRIRHRPLGDFNPNSIVGEYLFLQMVDDFLHDPTFPLNDIDDTSLSLLISIALLLQMPLPLKNNEIVTRKTRIEQLDWSNLFNLFGTFSKPLRDALEINTFKLDKKYWKFYYLRKCVEGMKKKNMSICEWKKIFYGKLLKNFPQYCLEFYQVQPPEYNSPVSAMLKLHCGHNENGLYYGKVKECSMSDIEGMNLIKPKNLQAEIWTIIVHLKERASKVLPFTSEEEAQSFLSMAQGLVKLCVRWDYFMSYDVLTRGEIMDSELRSFGPLKDSTAEAYLYDLSKKPSFSGRGFLIHQSTSEYQVYIVLTCTQSQMQGQGQLAYDDLQFERHRIALMPEGGLTLEKEGDESKENQLFWKQVDLRRSLLRQFGLQAQPRDYPRIADINDEYKYDIDPDIGDDAPPMLLARPLDLEREEKLPSLFLPKDLTAEIAIPDKNIKVRKFKVKYKDKAMMKVQVASNDEGEAEALREGLERLEKLRRFKPQRFLQLYNIVLERRMTVVMELAPHGDLLTYVCGKPQSPYDKVELMRQVVDVLQAMHECKNYHGNIRSRKFLVFDDPMTAHVRLKMEFPGVTSLLDTKPLDHKLNLERLPWLSPERREKLEEVTYESECYSVGTTLAEIVYRTDDFVEPAGVDSYDKVHDFFMENKNLSPPKSCGSDDLDNLWKNIWDTVILQCWNVDPNLRPLPNKLNHILKDIAKEAEEISDAARKEEVLKMKYEDVCNDEEYAPSMKQLQSLLQQKNNMFSAKDNLTLGKLLGQ
ncbi:tyrosine-protein kinase jak2-like, partial [Plakobranchus ocellatus]